MKIVKKDQLVEELQNLTESENEIIDNPGSSPVAEIADAVKDGIKDETNDEVVLSDKEAKEFAQDVKEVSKKMKIDSFVPSASVNELTRTLDQALRASEAKKDEEELFGDHNGECYNVLVSGLPGSGKTAIVKQWARLNNVNLCYVDAKNDDLEAFINGFTVRDNRYPDKNKITKGSSDGLALLERPRSVLFLDELNRQTKKQIRASLLTLINEHRITGDNDNPEDQDGYHYFKNLLFTVACINPALPTEKGADDLDDAEDSRFALKVDFDSNIDTAEDYLSKVFKSKMKAIEKQGKDFYLTHEKLYKKFFLEEALALHIIKHPIFFFDGRDALDDLQNYGGGKRYTMFNMRMFFQGIEISGGNKDDFIFWLDRYSNFRPVVIEMLHDILKYYEEPVFIAPEFEEDKNKTEEESEVEPEVNPVNNDEQDEESDYDFSEVDEEDEDDSQLFVGSNANKNGSRVAVSPTEVQNKINAFNFQ